VHNVLLFIHILAAATWLGANATQIVVNPIMQKTGGAPAAAWMRQTVRMGVVLYTPAAVVALITGFWMVFREPQYQFEQFFVALGIITVIVGGVLGARIFGPLGRKAADLHESGDEQGAAAVQSRLAMWGYLDTALVALTIYAMVSKLGVG
jgi:uncharacterized membrane protein